MKNTEKPRKDWFYPTHNFAALSAELSNEETSKIVVLPIPYESTTTYRAGCRRGPDAIIKASTNMELYDEELQCEPCNVGIHTSAPFDVVDDAKEMIARIDAVATAYLKKGKFLTGLGGEHTVTLGMVKAFQRKYSNLSVLHLDAHADFRQSYHGNKYNHACAARRISEISHIVQVGVRSLSSEEAQALRKKKIVTFWSNEFRKSGLAEARDSLINRLIENLTSEVYVSIDVDVFDPSIMPAVGTPEPGGLLWDDVLDIMRAVSDAREIVGLDLVELAPVDGMVHSEFMAARLIYKIWGYALKD